MNATNPRVEAIRQQMHTEFEELLQLIDQHIATRDQQVLYQIPTQDEWTITESLAHIVEFMTYWSNEIAKLVEHPGQNFGRTKEDTNRIRAIEEHSHDALNQMRIALPDSYGYMDDILKHLKDSDLEIPGYHVRFKEQTVGWFIKEFLTDHLENHIVQLREALALLK
ncbi:MAG TPA: hypothetical protein DHW02_23840 [Ktedonobacter sp.]|nr:hypothetical protein [Ktedonobacter sp.]